MRLKDTVIALLVLSLIGILAAFWLAPAGLREAPPASVTTLQGKQLSLPSLRGRPVLVTFWSTSCRSCVEEIPHLVELYREYAHRGLEIIGIAMAYDPPDRVIAMREARGITYPLALDIDSRVARTFGGVSVTPSSFLIAPDGRVVHQAAGELDMDKVRKLVAGMIAGNDTIAVN